jgi:DNA-binding CsgD family transcriptional regulator
MPPDDQGPSGPGAQPDTLDFCVDVASETLREALTHVGTRAGFELRLTVGPDTCHVVDEPKAIVGSITAQATVLVVEPTPCGAHAGMKALAAGTVSAVISNERPKDLANALEFVRNGWALAPLDLVDTASKMPDLSERQAVIVGAILAGQPTRDIAKGLYLSDASVKRELATLFRSFGADNRLELAAFGASLGFRPQRICP